MMPLVAWSRREDQLMRAFTLDSFERPPGLREDLPTPQVGPGQLLIRVQASSVNPVDVGIAAG
jgi:NADPH:quinone reductase